MYATRFIGLAILLALAPTLAYAEGEVNVYSQRQITLVDPLFQAFEADTGISVNVLYAGKGLVERIALEDSASPADVLLASDIGQLLAAAASIAQPVESSVLAQNIPANLRDLNNHWFGLTRRARMLFVAQARVSPRDASSGQITYESLANPQWENRLCMRDGQHPYNISLIAAMIARNGEEATRTWLGGLTNALARRPSGGDRGQMRAVASGACDIALANSYYYGVMLSANAPASQREAARALRPVFPVFENGGTHINLSGMVMARYAPNPDHALQLMEWLSTARAQNLFAAITYEYPVHPNALSPPNLPPVSSLNPDNTSFEAIFRQRAQASLLVDEVGLND